MRSHHSTSFRYPVTRVADCTGYSGMRQGFANWHNKASRLAADDAMACDDHRLSFSILLPATPTYLIIRWRRQVAAFEQK